MKSSCRLALVLALLAGTATVRAQEPERPLERQEIAARLAEAQATLTALAADAPQRPALEERVRLLTELGRVAEQAAARAAVLVGLEDRLRGLARQQEELRPEPVPDAPTRAGLDALQARHAEEASKEKTLDAALKEHVQRRDTLSAQLLAAKGKAEEAQARVAQLAEAVAAVQDPNARALRELELENARLASRLARRTAEAMQAEIQASGATERLLAAELELVRARVQMLESGQEDYAKALERAAEKERTAKQAEAEERAEEAAAAETPVSRFQARWKAAAARAEADHSQREVRLLELQRDLADEQKRLAAEQEEFEDLKDYLIRAGTSGRAAVRIKTVFANLKVRRQKLLRTTRSGLVDEINAVRDQRFDLEDQLFDVTERWKQELAEVLATLPEAERKAFKSGARPLYDDCVAALRAARAGCTDVIAAGQALQTTREKRLANLDEFEQFIRSKIFWVQDGKPLGAAALGPAQDELGRLADWVARFGSPPTLDRLSELASSALGIVLLILAFPILPALLVFARIQLRRFVRRRNERALQTTARVRDRVLTLLGGIVSAALLPLYLVAASALVQASGLSPELTVPVGRVLTHVAWFLFLWFLARSYLAPRGTLVAQYGTDAAAVRSLFRAVRLFLIAYLACFVPWRLLLQPPFSFEALPRIVYTVGQLIVIAGLWILIRRKSAFFERGLARARPQTFLVRHWTVLTTVVFLLALTALVMDVAGFRFGGRYIATALLLSLVTVIGLILVYTGAVTAVGRLLRTRRHASAAAPGEKPESRAQVEAQLQGFVRVLVFIAGLVLLAGYWRFDRQAFGALDEVVLHTVQVDGRPETLSLADVLKAVIVLAITGWLSRNLSGILELTLFLRMRADAGAKYAILTVSRYVLVAVGIVLALDALHLDLGRIGWLIAALGVGLGFGMQEIVSNFVSGLILLLERPIRVGDLVTIGGKTGRVLRINIRSTTLLDFDRQEVIVPNKGVITGTVTNLTGADTIVRLVLGIGVAYGTDPERVTSILQGVIERQPEILKDPAPRVVFVSHGESSLDFELRVFLPDPSHKVDVLDRMNKEINRALAEADIEIPFPQRDLHVRSSDVRLPVLQ